MHWHKNPKYEGMRKFIIQILSTFIIQILSTIPLIISSKLYGVFLVLCYNKIYNPLKNNKNTEINAIN